MSIATVVALVLEGCASQLPLAAVIALLVAVLYVAVVLPVSYGLDATHLIVRHGLLRRPIGLGDILSVEPARSLLASPALSLDRLLVGFGDGAFDSVMISPRERERFLQELSRDAGLERDGERLAVFSDLLGQTHVTDAGTLLAGLVALVGPRLVYDGLSGLA